MVKSVIGMRVNQGFTLLEIMVVLVIVGITFGFALISFGDFGQSRRVLMAADQFVNTVRLAQQQAVLESSTLGISIKDKSYQIYRFNPPASWMPVSDKGIFGRQYFPDNAFLHFTSAAGLKTRGPEIIINASGDMTPFKLSIATKNESLKTLIGRHDGLLSFK